jgi:hypothetical protein
MKTATLFGLAMLTSVGFAEARESTYHWLLKRATSECADYKVPPKDCAKRLARCRKMIIDAYRAEGAEWNGTGQSCNEEVFGY